MRRCRDCGGPITAANRVGLCVGCAKDCRVCRTRIARRGPAECLPCRVVATRIAAVHSRVGRCRQVPENLESRVIDLAALAAAGLPLFGGS